VTNGFRPDWGAVLFARDDSPGSAQSAASELITAGGLAHELAARCARGVHRLAGALSPWVGREHADELQRHIEKGKLVLRFELAQPQDLGAVCGRLIQTSPHVVGMCNTVSRV